MIKICESCGTEFNDRPVYHTCPECRQNFQEKMDQIVKEANLIRMEGVPSQGMV